MSTSKDQEYYQTYLQNFDDDTNDDQIENNGINQTETINFYSDADGEVADNKNNIIVDADGNYYYRSSEKIVNVENLTKFPVIQSSVVVFPSNETINKTNTKINVKEERNDGNMGKKINSEIRNQDEVYDFDENAENPDDPLANVIDADYKYKGVISKKKTTANEQSFSCTMCPYQSNKKFLLSRHIKTHSDERPFKCSVCERGFKTNTALSNHRNTHLGYKPHACSSCEMAFTTSGELVRHVRYRHTRIKPHKCTECDYCSVEMSKLRRHMRCHTGERPYQCPHCTYASPDTFKLKRHMRIHTGEKPYECDICHARFTQSNSLKHHRLIHSVNDKPVFQCHLCPTTCGRKTDLRLHIKKLHSSDQPLPCKRCGKELPDRYSYKMHMKTHEGEKCYRCEYCPYASISNRHLESHVLIHLDEKPFLCEICQSTFRQKALLSRHMKIYHLNNYEPPQPRKKDHKCPHCNKMFAFNGNLIRHMEIHDPTSRLHENKEKLRMGRMKRVNPDGTVVTLPSSNHLSKLLDGSEGSVYDESEEQHQIEDVEIGEGCEETEEYDGDNVHYVYDDYEADEYEEQFEEVQSQQHSDESSDRNNLTVVKQEFDKTLIVKGEGDNDSEIMSLALQDDQGIMVIQVLPDDGDDDDEEAQQEEQFQKVELQTIKSKTIIKTNNRSVLKESRRNAPSRISDYFGFEVNAEEEDEETAEAAQLLALMAQD